MKKHYCPECEVEYECNVQNCDFPYRAYYHSQYNLKTTSYVSFNFKGMSERVKP